MTVDEGATLAISTSLLNATDDEDMPANPQTLVFEIKTNSPNSNSPMAFGRGVLKKDGVELTKTDVFTLKDIQDGKITYSHDGSETDYDEFQFSLKDRKGEYYVDGTSSVFSFKINVTPVNDPPVASNLNFESSFAQPLVAQLQATDAEGSNLTFEIVDQPASGTVDLTDNEFTYTASSGFVGNVSFTYRAFDDDAYSSPATVSIEVKDLPPVVSNQSFNSLEGNAIEDMLDASDVEGSDLTFDFCLFPDLTSDFCEV